MKIQDFNTAKDLRARIDHFSVKLSQVKRMRNRDDDKEFQTLKELAYDGCEYAMNTLEEKFKNL
jgi:hypothetical protein